MIDCKKFIYTYVYTYFMATKTLTITEDAYGLLKSFKLEDESFSEEIMRVLSPGKRKLSDFWGILSEETADKIEKGIVEDRKRNATRRTLREEKLYDR